MQISQLLVPTLAVMVLYLVAPSSGGFTLSKHCVKMCGTCVMLYGKDLYDGRACADSCEMTKGQSMDDQCRNENFHLIKRGGTQLSCKKFCGLCVIRWGKDFYDGMSCAAACDITKGKSVDRECQNPLFNTLESGKRSLA